MDMLSRLLVLSYHHVHEGVDPSFRLTPTQLRGQLQLLLSLGYQFIGLDELLRPKGPVDEHESRILVTFDDGYQDFLYYAWPILEELYIPCILFLISDYIGRWNVWDSLRITDHRHLDLSQLRHLREKGIHFGSHSRTHPPVIYLRREALFSEVQDSQHKLESLLGTPIRTFAYPGGHVNQRVSQVVQKYYDLAFATHFQTGARPDNLYRIPRLDASQFPEASRLVDALSLHTNFIRGEYPKHYWEFSMNKMKSSAVSFARDHIPASFVNMKKFITYAVAPLRERFGTRFPKVNANRILGIACTGHGASLAYMDKTGLLRSSQLERWTGVKHMLLFSADENESIRNPNNDVDRLINFIFQEGYGRFPDSIVFEENIYPWMNWLLRDLDIQPEDIDLVVTSDGHFATGWARLGPELKGWFPQAYASRNIEHHEIHQRQAFWPSGFEEAAVLTLDTCGESLRRLGWRKLSGTISVMNRSGECQILKEFFFPEMSSGTIYDATTHHVGFRQGDEGKTMGLAPFGDPELYEQLKVHLHLHEDGGFEFMDTDAYQAALDAYVPARQPSSEMTHLHENVAYAGQAILEDIVTNAWRATIQLTGQRNLVYAGGVALNSVANEKAYRSVRPERLYIPPCPGDPGQALGCVLFAAYELAGWTSLPCELPEYLGPPYTAQEINAAVAGSGFPSARPDELEAIIARCIANGHIIARFDGGAEFGPRALGNRSILCDPRRPGMKDYLNSKVKHREAFRPFAPTVLEERASEWFDLDGRSPYMLRVVPILPDKVDMVPAIAHIDNTARVQTLSEQENPGYWRLIKAFDELTDVPMVLNTSFNIAGKPIVESPQDAVACFEQTEIDVLIMGWQVLSKQPLEHYLSTVSQA